ncbi:YdeI/OmpD-associated family protein, partial [Campylobacter fetus subsp. venerealis]
KEEGDSVTVTLFRKEVPYQAPEELIDCLKDDPGKLELFHLLPEADQRHWVEYIYSSEKMDEQSDRIIKLLHSLLP